MHIISKYQALVRGHTHGQSLNPLMLHNSSSLSSHPSVQHWDACSSHRDRCGKTHRTSSPFLLKMNWAPAPHGAVPDAEQPKRGLVILLLGQRSPKAQRFISAQGFRRGRERGWSKAHAMPLVTHSKGVGKSQGDRTCASTSHHRLSVISMVFPGTPCPPWGFFKQTFSSNSSV